MVCRVMARVGEVIHNCGMDTPLAHLNNLSATQFLRRHWQKKPLLVRAAFPSTRLPVGRAELFALAAQPDLRSRKIRQTAQGWEVHDGPFPALKRTRSAPWTVLVQDVNTQVSALAQLLREFRFLPDARLDDVMVSYATPGGGVGPHVDSYDVFLLQARGTRRWHIGPLKTARDRALLADQPLKILANFKPTASFDLAPGDMLYLPPGYGHDGVAVDECVTYSIGFRAPSAGELLAQLFERMATIVRAHPQFSTLYRDGAERISSNSAIIPEAMLQFVQNMLPDALPTPGLIEQAIGEYLSEPKPHIPFTPVEQADFQHGLKLADQSRLLLGEAALYLNGEAFDLSARDAAWWREFAASQQCTAAHLARAPAHTRDIIEEAVNSGWLQPGEAAA
jgi:50S ribosomal protein L16 3-hydroxylase